MQAEDEDIWGCLRFGEGGEEMGREDCGIDRLTAAIKGDDVRSQSRHDCLRLVGAVN